MTDNEKRFTQAEVDRLIKARQARDRAKWERDGLGWWEGPSDEVRKLTDDELRDVIDGLRDLTTDYDEDSPVGRYLFHLVAHPTDEWFKRHQARKRRVVRPE